MLLHFCIKLKYLGGSRYITPKHNIQLSLSLFLFLQALMLENLQKSSSSHCGLQPNSQVHIYSVYFCTFFHHSPC